MFSRHAKQKMAFVVGPVYHHTEFAGTGE